MTKNNPFPGMNPFLERHWSDVHTKLITYIADAIAEDLPLELNARSEERVTLYGADGKGASLRADVAVMEPWKRGIPPQWRPGATTAGGVIATKPVFVLHEEITERWIEISDRNGKLITVIEVLSPANKDGDIRGYLSRRDTYLQAGVNLVEIDLLRGGTHVLAVPLRAVETPGSTRYLTCVSRATCPEGCEVYVTPLREPLPDLSIPLREKDADIVLPLQPLVDRCHRMGGYWNANYRRIPDPALPEDEARWVHEQVMAAGLLA
ncbi:MAG: DUF4058 family protein [Verrucomicrobiaceae bacterium]